MTNIAYEHLAKTNGKGKIVKAKDNTLHHLAFDHSAQANIILTVSSGKIVTANRVACKMLGYSKKELVTKGRKDIFKITENSFKNMLKQRAAAGRSDAEVTVIKKNGRTIHCLITSAVFMEGGNEKAIITITDMSTGILRQKNIDTKKEKLVAENIIKAVAKQIDIDLENKKVVAENIVLAIAKQVDIDVKNKKIVADNIALALSKQKNIDIKNRKIVADDIALAISKQLKIDTQNKKIVADNIALAKSKQKNIDVKNKKVVADNIVLAILKQIKVDATNKKLVAENIVLAIAKQIEIDDKNKKIVTDNIALAIADQKIIDARKEKIVAGNIVLALLKQKSIDAENEKTVVHNIEIARSKQKTIDAKNEKAVADNIAEAISKQKNIDIKNAKTVSDNILLAISKQIEIDDSNAKIVADNIAEAISKQKNIDIKNTQLVADNIALAISKQIKIDDQNAKIVAANIALAISKQKSIDIKKAKTVADNIIVAISKQIKIDDQNAKIVADNIALAIFKQKNIDANNAKIVSDNILLAISKQLEIDAKKEKIVSDNIILAKKKSAKEKKAYETTIKEKLVTEFKENIKLALNSTDHNLRKFAFDKSQQPSLVSTAKDGKIELVNNAFCKLLGYSKEELLTKSRKDIVDMNEAGFKKMLSIRNNKGQATGFVKMINKKGKNIPCQISTSTFIDKDGIEKAIISLSNLSRQKYLEGKLNIEIAAKEDLLKEYKDTFKLIFNSSADIIYDADLITNKVIVNEAYEKELGYKITNDMSPVKNFFSHIHPEDSETVMTELNRALASQETERKYSYRVMRADNSIANLIGSSIILRNVEGKAVRLIGSLYDNSKEQIMEEKLANAIKLKETQIKEAMQEAKEAERSEIGKELHDNVNQLLGASKLYLEMAKQGGDKSEFYLNRSTQYTLTAIEEIRKLTKGLTTDVIKNLGLGEAINTIATDTMEIHPLKIVCELENFIELNINHKFKLNVFRIVQEQLNNILKHAKATEVIIKLSQNKKSVILSISDNGIGFDTNKQRKGIGVDNIKSRAANYKGTADFVSQAGKGCGLLVTFPVTNVIYKDNTIKSTALQ